MSWTYQPDRLAKVTKEQPPKAVATEIRDAKQETTYKTNSAEARKRDGHRCRICGSMFNLETHHFIPRSLAGRKVRDRVDNLVTLCGGNDGCHPLVTKHVIKLYAINPGLGTAARNLRVEKFDKNEGDYIVAIEAA
jgi:5-methylcytosine-specific restriction endonuclease McrA